MDMPTVRFALGEASVGGDNCRKQQQQPYGRREAAQGLLPRVSPTASLSPGHEQTRQGHHHGGRQNPKVQGEHPGLGDQE